MFSCSGATAVQLAEFAIPTSTVNIIPVPTAIRSSVDGVIDTLRHSERVAAIGETMLKQLCAEKMDLGDTRICSGNIESLKYAFIFHDIGKLLTPKSILSQKSRLSRVEFEVVKRHTTDIGGYIRRAIEKPPDMSSELFRCFINTTIEIATLHHERLDGTGYPWGLGADQISGVVRVCSIADSIDAMASKRVYSDEMTWEEIETELIRGSSEQFDTRLVILALDHREEIEFARTNVEYKFGLMPEQDCGTEVLPLHQRIGDRVIFSL